MSGLWNCPQKPSKTHTASRSSDSSDAATAGPQSSGLKRNRLGQLTSMNLPLGHKRPTTWKTQKGEDVIASLDLQNDGSTGSDNGEEEDYEIVRAYNLEPGHPFRNLAPELARDVYGGVRDWAASARYVAPPDDRLPPRKRLKTTSRQPQHLYRENEDEDEADLVVVSKIDGYFHLACPFFASNPKDHESCLVRSDLQSVEDVIRHLQEDHREAPYCPICGQTFSQAEIRDQHLMAKTCKVSNTTEAKGVNKTQQDMLVKYDRVQLGERERWSRVWKTIFSDAKPPRSPYLDNGLGKTVSLFRDYWEAHGDECTLRFLRSRGFASEQDLDQSEASSALTNLALHELLIMAREQHAQSCVFREGIVSALQPLAHRSHMWRG